MIQHVTFEIRREQAEDCVGFYRLLGFEPADPPPSLRDRAAWVGRGGTQIHLMWVDDPVTLPRGHVAVVPDDYDATLERLRGEGHDPEPRREHWGAPRSYVHDPAGNLVEILAFPPPGA